MTAMDGPGVKRMSRSLQFKRKKDVNSDGPKVSLERVLGLTAASGTMLAVDPKNNLIAYPAGCVIVLHRKNKQDQIFNHAKKTITALSFSADGKFLVTGECGHMPAVRVFNVEEKVQVSEFHGHKFGIACAAFSPSHKYIVSIGTQHDMIVNVWNLRSESKAASNKVSCKVNAIDFSEGGSMFVTAGNRHVKFWYLDASQSEVRNETVPLLGRSGILADQKNNNFVDVVCGRGDCASSTFVITQSGLLCEFSVKRLLIRLVELRTTRAFSLAGGKDALFVGCADGIVRTFSSKTLQFIVTLPKPHPLGIDIMSGTSITSPKSESSYPDVVAVQYNQEKHELVSINNDHSLYIWDVRDLRRVGKVASFLYHSSCIWGVEVYPACESDMLTMLPPGSFMTCSSDDTIRVWNLDPHWHAVSDATPKRNIYSTELLKIVYTDPSLSCLCEQDENQAGTAEKSDAVSDTRTGVRCLSVSPDGQHLASGDRSGNLRLHDLQFMDEITIIEAHDSEILCLEFSDYSSGYKLLCSASRDRLIHVFDVSENFSLLQTLDDHSASVMSVKLTWSPADQMMWMLSCGADKSILFRAASLGGELPFQFTLRHHLVSKSTLHDMIVDPTQRFTVTACQDRNIRIYNMETGKQKKAYKASLGDDGTLLKVTHDRTGAYLAASCSDKTTAVLDFFTGDVLGTMYGHSEVVTGVRFSNDLKHVITVSADGCIFIWRLHPDLTHKMQARLKDSGREVKAVQSSTTPMLHQAALGQNDIPATLSLINDSAVATDIKNEDAISMRRARPGLLSAVIGLTPVREDIDAEVEEDASDGDMSPDAAMDYRFSMGQLPSWAKKQLADVAGASEHVDEEGDNIPGTYGDGTPKGSPVGSVKYTSPTCDENKTDDFHEILNGEVIYYPTEEANRENDGDFTVVEAPERDHERDSTSDNASVLAYEEEDDDEPAAVLQLAAPSASAPTTPFDQALHDFEQDELELGVPLSGSIETRDGQHHIPAALLSSARLSQLRDSLGLPPRSKLPVSSQQGLGTFGSTAVSQPRMVPDQHDAAGRAQTMPSKTNGLTTAGSLTEDPVNRNHGHLPVTEAVKKQSSNDSARLSTARRSQSRESLHSSGDSLRSVQPNEDGHVETARQRSQSSRDLAGWKKANNAGAAARPTELPVKAIGTWTSSAANGVSVNGIATDDRLSKKGLPNPGLSAAAAAVVERLSNSSRRQDPAFDAPPLKEASAIARATQPRVVLPLAGQTPSAPADSSVRLSAHSDSTKHDVALLRLGTAEEAATALTSAVALVKHSREQLLCGVPGGIASDKQLAHLDAAVHSALSQLSSIVSLPSPAAAAESLMEPFLHRYSDALLAMLREKLESIETPSRQRDRGSEQMT